MRELYELAECVGWAAATWVRNNRPAGRVTVADHKSSETDPVTALDRGCEQLIRDKITRVRPDDGFIGEESESTSGTSGVDWIVDPIDGTVNFVYGIGSWAVSIAARRNGETVAGFVVDGVRNVSWGAIRSQGAWRNHLDRSDHDGAVMIQSGGVSDINHALIATGFHYRKDIRSRQAVAAAIMLPQVRDVRRLGSAALDICAVADGSLDGYVEQGLQPWDWAAAELIARESGAIIGGLKDEPPERLMMIATPAIARDFFALINVCGF